MRGFGIWGTKRNLALPGKREWLQKVRRERETKMRGFGCMGTKRSRALPGQSAGESVP